MTNTLVNVSTCRVKLNYQRLPVGCIFGMPRLKFPVLVTLLISTSVKIGFAGLLSGVPHGKENPRCVSTPHNLFISEFCILKETILIFFLASWSLMKPGSYTYLTMDASQVMRCIHICNPTVGEGPRWWPLPCLSVGKNLGWTQWQDGQRQEVLPQHHRSWAHQSKLLIICTCIFEYVYIYIYLFQTFNTYIYITYIYIYIIYYICVYINYICVYIYICNIHIYIYNISL